MAEDEEDASASGSWISNMSERPDPVFLFLGGEGGPTWEEEGRKKGKREEE